MRRLLKLRNGNGKISKDSYNDAIETLASIGIDMSYATSRKRVSRARSVASDDIPPTKEVTMSGEEFSGVSSLTPVTLSDVTEGTANADKSTGDDEASGNSSKVGRPKGSTEAYKREMDLKYEACVNSITREFFTLHGTTSKQLPLGALSDLIESKKEEYEIKQEILESTIHS